MAATKSNSPELPLSVQQQNQVIAKTEACIGLATEHYGLQLKPIQVLFDIKGSAWGYYVRKHKQQLIRYNPWLFARHFTEGLNDTVPHEVAHYIVDMRYRRRCKPHGPEWREVMQFFGIEKPRATAHYRLDGIPVRRQRRHVYYCDCQAHEISSTRHYRIQRGIKYACRRCGSHLRAEQSFGVCQ